MRIEPIHAPRRRDADAEPADTAASVNEAGQLLKRIKRQGLSPTVNRLCVMQVMASRAGRPSTAADILRALLLRGTSISSSTLYRVLAELLRSGLIVEAHGRTKGERMSYLLAPAQLDPLIRRQQLNPAA